jgi:hypothetical protein
VGWRDRHWQKKKTPGYWLCDNIHVIWNWLYTNPFVVRIGFWLNVILSSPFRIKLNCNCIYLNFCCKFCFWPCQQNWETIELTALFKIINLLQRKNGQ